MRMSRNIKMKVVFWAVNLAIVHRLIGEQILLTHYCSSFGNIPIMTRARVTTVNGEGVGQIQGK